MSAVRAGVISFVRQYEAYGHTWYDVIYSTGRAFTFIDQNLPKTVLNFIAKATKVKHQYDRTVDRIEVIYRA